MWKQWQRWGSIKSKEEKESVCVCVVCAHYSHMDLAAMNSVMFVPQIQLHGTGKRVKWKIDSERQSDRDKALYMYIFPYTTTTITVIYCATIFSTVHVKWGACARLSYENMFCRMTYEYELKHITVWRLCFNGNNVQHYFFRLTLCSSAFFLDLYIYLHYGTHTQHFSFIGIHIVSHDIKINIEYILNPPYALCLINWLAEYGHVWQLVVCKLSIYARWRNR